MNKHSRRWMISVLMMLCCQSTNLMAQYSQGSTGLLTIPTADMQDDGTFMCGANFMPSTVTPNAWDYNTLNYFLNMTFLPFFEVGYLCTLIRFNNGIWNQDRALSVRLRVLKEAKWYPAIVVGTNDALSFSQDNDYNIFESVNSNRYYSTVYGVATKSFNIAQERVGMTIGYGYKTQEHSYKDGLFYGVSYTPSFYDDGKVMVDVNGDILSLGVAVKLFDRLSVNAFCYDFKAFVGGLRYEVALY